MPSDERRRALRLEVRIPVGVYYRDKPHEVIDAEITNISESGAFIESADTVEVGQNLMLELRLGESRFLTGVVTKPDNDDPLPAGIQGRAVIRWADKNKGFGVEFTNLDSEKRHFLDRLLDQLESQSRKG